MNERTKKLIEILVRVLKALLAALAGSAASNSKA